MRRLNYFGIWVPLGLLTIGLGQLAPRVFPGAMPQVAGEDILALVLGDTRRVVSFAALKKADAYFHGGVESLEGDGVAHLQAEEDEHAHASERPLTEDEAHVNHWSPWTWLSRRVHVQTHQHLTPERAEELLPWLWVACRTAPANTQAYESTAFILSKWLNRPDEAVALLKEGLRKNPESIEVELYLGEILLHTQHDLSGAERAFKSVRTKCQASAAGQERDVMLLRSLYYLSYLAQQRGDQALIQAYLGEAEAISARDVCTRDIRNLLQKQ